MVRNKVISHRVIKGKVIKANYTQYIPLALSWLVGQNCIISLNIVLNWGFYYLN